MAAHCPHQRTVLKSGYPLSYAFSMCSTLSCYLVNANGLLILSLSAFPQAPLCPKGAATELPRCNELPKDECVPLAPLRFLYLQH